MAKSINLGVIHDSGWLRIENKKENIVVIDIEGVIGGSFWDEDEEQKNNTKAKMSAELKAIAALKPTKIIVNINSLGGDVGHGISIHDLLVQNTAEIETRVVGLSASIATVIAQAGNKRSMSANALYLVHMPMFGILGMFNEIELENMRSDLNTVSTTMKAIYTKRGVEPSVLEDLMTVDNGNGKWLSADDTLEMGLVDEVYEPMKMAAMVLDKNIQNAMHLPDLPTIQKTLPFNKLQEQAEEEKKNNNQFLDIMKKELMDMFAGLKGWFTDNFKKEGSDESTIPAEAQAKLDELEAKIEKVGIQEDQITELEGQVETLTSEKTTAADSLKASEEKIAALQTDLAQAKAGSTKKKGKEGMEDAEDLDDELNKSLANDIAKLKGRFN